MDDPIPAGFMTLPEAVRRIAAHVSEAQLERAKIDRQKRLRAIRAMRQKVEQDATATNEPVLPEAADCQAFERPSEEALRQWNKHNFAVSKLYLAFQTGAIEAMVRDPSSGGWSRLVQDVWRFEPFWEVIVRGGVIPQYAGRGLVCHRGRAVLIEITHFERWLPTETKSWPQASREDLARNWLADKMRASLEDKGQTKAKWFAQAKLKFL